MQHDPAPRGDAGPRANTKRGATAHEQLSRAQSRSRWANLRYVLHISCPRVLSGSLRRISSSLEGRILSCAQMTWKSGAALGGESLEAERLLSVRTCEGFDNGEKLGALADVTAPRKSFR